MFLASVPEPGVGTRVRAGPGETGILTVGKWSGEGRLVPCPGDRAAWLPGVALKPWVTGKQAEVCYRCGGDLPPGCTRVTTSEDQLVISYRTG